MGSGGAERVVSILANQLSKRFKIIIITFIKAPIFYELHESIEVFHCTTKILPSRTFFDALKSNLKLVIRVRLLLKKNDVDLCIGFMTTANVISIISSKWQRIPVIISERNNPFMEDSIVPRFWKIMRRLTYKKANYLVVQTETIKRYYTKTIPEKKLKTIPNPVNPDFYDFPAMARQNIILNVGRLTKQKGQDLLVRAFNNMKPKLWQLHIVGEGEDRTYLEKLIGDLNMNKSVKLLGRQKNIAKYYNSAKIFAFTSLYEGFPNALSEAMFFGMACVSTDCPTGPAELITEGLNGYLVPVNDQSALEERLLYLMDNEEARLRIGETAKKSMANFKANIIAGQWISLIDDLL
jgi:GalNAc-alpha-(1->4)-GalNAc-alpha-(1->3)-diNAcBac-PP-undecaprenol alpha-1,4-N-acetyl-D-galactosaminyltransferase